MLIRVYLPFDILLCILYFNGGHSSMLILDKLINIYIAQILHYCVYMNKAER